MNENIEEVMTEEVPDAVKATCSKMNVNSAVNFVGYVAIGYVGYKAVKFVYAKVKNGKRSNIKEVFVKKNSTDVGGKSESTSEE